MTASATLAALAARVRDVPAVAAAAAAAAVREEALTHARAAAGGDLALTGKHSPITLNVEVTESSEPGAARAHLAGTPAGPWRWIETGTRPHSIRRRKRGNLARVYVHHPGTAGKGAWTATVAAAPDLARTAIDVAVTEAVA